MLENAESANVHIIVNAMGYCATPLHCIMHFQENFKETLPWLRDGNGPR
jgi:hypothetical protein